MAVNDDDKLIPDPQCREEAGGVCDMTWWRWERMYDDFPRCYRLGRRKYRRASEWRAWLERRVESV